MDKRSKIFCVTCATFRPGTVCNEVSPTDLNNRKNTNIIKYVQQKSGFEIPENDHPRVCNACRLIYGKSVTKIRDSTASNLVLAQQRFDGRREAQLSPSIKRPLLDVKDEKSTKKLKSQQPPIATYVDAIVNLPNLNHFRSAIRQLSENELVQEEVNQKKYFQNDIPQVDTTALAVKIADSFSLSRNEIHSLRSFLDDFSEKTENVNVIVPTKSVINNSLKKQNSELIEKFGLKQDNFEVTIKKNNVKVTL